VIWVLFPDKRSIPFFFFLGLKIRDDRSVIILFVFWVQILSKGCSSLQYQQYHNAIAEQIKLAGKRRFSRLFYVNLPSMCVWN
jgi:hypothetical protein